MGLLSWKVLSSSLVDFSVCKAVVVIRIPDERKLRANLSLVYTSSDCALMEPINRTENKLFIGRLSLIFGCRSLAGARQGKARNRRRSVPAWEASAAAGAGGA